MLSLQRARHGRADGLRPAPGTRRMVAALLVAATTLGLTSGPADAGTKKLKARVSQASTDVVYSATAPVVRAPEPAQPADTLPAPVPAITLPPILSPLSASPTPAPGTPAPTARFSYSPSSPAPGQEVTFNGANSSCAATPCTYTWDDVGPNGDQDWPLGNGTTMRFTFRVAGSKYVQLTLTDAQGRTSTSRRTVVVAASAAPSP